MKRLILLILLFSVVYISFASENMDNWTFYGGLGFTYPIDSNMETSKNIIGSLLFSTVSFGTSYQFDIVENVLSPGIYIDVHLGIFSLFGTREENATMEERGFYIHSGIRLFNEFILFDLLDIKPLIGVNFIVGAIVEPVFLTSFGLSMGIKRFVLEYSYNIPFKDFSNGNKQYLKDNLHRIVFLFRF